MSQENVDVVARVIASGNDGDLETMLALHHPEWEGYIPDEYPVAGTWRGLDGVRAFVLEWLTAWEDFRVVPEEYVHGGDAVMVAVRYWGKGRASGMEISDRWFYAYRLRGGKIIAWQPFAERADALEALGLADAAPPPP